MKNFNDYSKKYFDEMKRIRHYLHQNPELSTQEFKTSAYIKAELDKMGIPYQEMFNTGISALIEGGKPGKCVLLRADIDALEVNEEADVDYKSTVEGKMHACGHDGHVAGLLGAAMVLNEIKDELSGSVKLMFQPGEEINPGGAKFMIEEGILENPKVDAVFGLHLWGPIQRGKVCVKKNEMMAAVASLDIKLKGRGAHAAMPHLGIDPVVMGAEAIMALQTIPSRLINPLEPVVLSLCTVKAGDDTYNVIPEYLSIKGTVRTLSDEVRNEIETHINNILTGITTQYNGSYELDYSKGYPALINDDAMTELAKDSIAKVIGNENVSYLKDASMGAEDFAYLLKEVPGSFFFVGISEPDNDPAIHHHPKFAWDDEILIESSAMLCQIAYDFLNK